MCVSGVLPWKVAVVLVAYFRNLNVLVCFDCCSWVVVSVVLVVYVSKLFCLSSVLDKILGGCKFSVDCICLELLLCILPSGWKSVCYVVLDVTLRI